MCFGAASIGFCKLLGGGRLGGKLSGVELKTGATPLGTTPTSGLARPPKGLKGVLGTRGGLVSPRDGHCAVHGKDETSEKSDEVSMVPL